MLIDDTGCYVLAGSIDHAGGRFSQVFSNRSYFTIFDQYVGLFQHAFLFVGPHGGVFDQNGLLLRARIADPTEWLHRIDHVAYRRCVFFLYAVGFDFTEFDQRSGPTKRIAQ